MSFSFFFARTQSGQMLLSLFSCYFLIILSLPLFHTHSLLVLSYFVFVSKYRHHRHSMWVMQIVYKTICCRYHFPSMSEIDHNTLGDDIYDGLFHVCRSVLVTEIVCNIRIRCLSLFFNFFLYLLINFLVMIVKFQYSPIGLWWFLQEFFVFIYQSVLKNWFSGKGLFYSWQPRKSNRISHLIWFRVTFLNHLFHFLINLIAFVTWLHFVRSTRCFCRLTNSCFTFKDKIIRKSCEHPLVFHPSLAVNFAHTTVFGQSWKLIAFLRQKNSVSFDQQLSNLCINECQHYKSLNFNDRQFDSWLTSLYTQKFLKFYSDQKSKRNHWLRFLSFLRF